jgi:periplasmic protein TonB
VQPQRRSPSGPWGRLAWTLPLALILTASGMAGFLNVVARQRLPSPSPQALAVQIVELPPAPQAQTPPSPETTPPTPVQPPPPPPPVPAIETPPPAPPKRESTPPPPRKSTQPVHRDLTRTPVQHPSASSTETAPVAAATPTAPGGITMGARALYRPMPDIPEALRHRQLSLVATARFQVAADGGVTVTLLQATADPGLNAALTSALQKWRFFPAMSNGLPIASTIDIRIPIEVR